MATQHEQDTEVPTFEDNGSPPPAQDYAEIYGGGRSIA